MTQSAAAMASTLPRFLPRRLCQSSPLPRFSQSIPRKSPPLRNLNLSTRRGYASGPNRTPGNNPLKIWPFVAIVLAGSGAYVLMVRSRVDMAPATGQIAAPKKDTPTFSPSKVTVIFVLGGPGAGKGTQCANLVRDYKFTHLSAGDLLRAEQDREGSEFGDLIKSYIKDGKIVPMEVTVQLLENAMTDVVSKDKDGKGKFLVDGFPRKMDQALKFDETVCPSKFVLFYDCPEEEMQKRLLNRGKTSGRSDDNEESIKKRFKTFVETSMPVVDYFDGEGRVVKVVATKSPDEVYKETKEKIEQRLGKNF
ncbi:UMP-CMP kinase [Mollisia scopiformis]|uniref:Uridylate kinase n=1 Tax=Mollisia scopiformis TaxID=149040 RepID=A0A194XQR7_MOLSC|nr:UMP-CMP kinase [Mollisia scopiformis]KUJ22516.1 UMP-CMP kinase [Mollisia scopiformis]